MPDSHPRLAAAYIRVSTEDQTEYSPDAQIVEIRRYAGTHGYVIPNSLVFMDEGISGKSTGKRDAFNRMIGMAKSKPKPFDAILLWKFSRFARNREDSIVYKSMLRKQLGIEVISISEPVGDDKMSILIEAMIEAMDEYYSINLAEEVKRGMTEKARRGGLQSIPCFGYTVKDNILTPIHGEAGLVRSIFARFIAGEGLFPIVKWLNDMGVTTHRGGRFESRSVEYILRNPAYIGKLRWNPSGRTRRDFTNENIILAEARHEPLISLETWEAAQRRMDEVKAGRNYHGRPLSEHKDWISGLVRCSDCGCTLIFSKPHYWKCNGYARGICKSSQHISDNKLKGMILAKMTYDMYPGVSAFCTLIQPGPEAPDEGTHLQEQQKSIQARLARLREAYLSGVETLEGYAEAKTTLERQAAFLAQSLQERRSPASKEKADALTKKSIGACVDLLRNPTVDMEKKKLAAHSIIDCCIYNKEANTLSLIYHISGHK